MATLLFEGGLSIRWWEIAIHILNFIIIVIGLKLFVYKPVVSFIATRQNKLAQIDSDNKALNSEVETMRKDKEKIFDETRKSAEYITLDATKKAEERSKEILSEAKQKAEAVLERAHKDIENQKMLMEQEIRAEVADLAVEIAGKVLEREVSERDNKKIIDDCLKGWQ